MNKMKRQGFSALVAAITVLSLALSGCGQNADTTSSAVSGFAGGKGTTEDPYQISTVKQFDQVHEDLTASYVLTDDIDLSNVKFAPIDTFKPASDKEEDAEVPDETAAFSGTFDGAGHTVTGAALTGDTCTGLFGCVAGEKAGITNLTLKDCSATGGQYTGAVIGYAYYNVKVDNITLIGNNNVTGTSLVGGIVGACHADVTNCTATANITIDGDGAQGAGIIVGGQEDGNFQNCTASGNVTATGKGSYSIGGLAGCAQTSRYVKNCSVHDVTITVAENDFLVGALLGHAGQSADKDPTLVTDCSASNYTINAGNGSQRIGGIVGGGFYTQKYVQYYPEPNAFQIEYCTAQGVVNGGSIVGSIAGYVYSNSKVDNCTGSDPQIGASLSDVPLSQLY